jgi:hypothetical protein
LPTSKTGQVLVRTWGRGHLGCSSGELEQTACAGQSSSPQARAAKSRCFKQLRLADQKNRTGIGPHLRPRKAQ